MNRGRLEIRETKIYAVEDAVELGFAGGKTIVRTFRRTYATKIRKTKNGKKTRVIVGEPTKEVVYHVSSLDAASRTAEQFARLVRTHWYVEVYHGKRDNAYLEDRTARRCDENLMSAMMVARSFGMWCCARYVNRHSGKTTADAMRYLYGRPSELIRIVLKEGLI